MSNTTDEICPCGSPRWMEILGKYNQLNSDDISSKCDIGNGKIIWFSVCLNCGIQGEWPDKQTIALRSNDSDDNVKSEISTYSPPIRSKTSMLEVTMRDKETYLYIDNQEGLLIVFTEDNNLIVLGFILTVKFHNLPQSLQVIDYDREKHLYIDIICDLLLFAEEGKRPLVVGYLLNGKITPLTAALRDIANNRDLAICDTHFDDTKDNASLTHEKTQ